MPPLEWENLQRLKVANFQCGYCDRLIASEWGWVASDSQSVIYICPNCSSPSFFEMPNWVGGHVVPAPKLGEAVNHLPEDVQRVYEEARRCTSSGAYTAAVMLCRKLLMHIAVEKGAKKEGLSYAAYVTFLDENGYVPPDGKAWVDEIRNLGNEANHELPDMLETDTKDALDFTGMLLKFVYEFPRRRRKAPENK